MVVLKIKFWGIQGCVYEQTDFHPIWPSSHKSLSFEKTSLWFPARLTYTATSTSVQNRWNTWRVRFVRSYALAILTKTPWTKRICEYIETKKYRFFGYSCVYLTDIRIIWAHFYSCLSVLISSFQIISILRLLYGCVYSVLCGESIWMMPSLNSEQFVRTQGTSPISTFSGKLVLMHHAHSVFQPRWMTLKDTELTYGMDHTSSGARNINRYIKLSWEGNIIHIHMFDIIHFESQA